MSLPRHWRLPVGNDYLSLPSLSAADASAPDLNFISMRWRGLVELKGEAGLPFLAPRVELGGKRVDLGKAKDLKASRQDYWTPKFDLAAAGAYELGVRYLCPPSERGLVLELRLRNTGKKALKAFLGAEGCWSAAGLRINDPYPLKVWRRIEQYGGLAARHLALTLGSAAPDFSLAVGSGDAEGLDTLDFALGGEPKPAKWDGKRAIEAAEGEGKRLRWVAGRHVEVQAGQEAVVPVFLCLGLDPTSAAATCVEFKRRGLKTLSEQTERWLRKRQRRTGDARLDDLLNWNLFFNLFFAMGVTLDTEEFVCLTSRSPHYYVSGAYWDRDSLLWSFSSTLMADQQRARRVLEYAFGRQGRNIGVHSRFLDGTVLEPGFELDELCAPVVALAQYVKQSGDASLLKDWKVKDVLRSFERQLNGRKHASLQLYETTSGPDDDFEPLPYLTIDNVLVWKALQSLADLKPRMGRDHEAGPLREQAGRVKQAIWANLVAEGPRGRMFVWASDLRGEKRFYTSPPGCLQLLPYYGFCDQGEQAWRNTQAWLHSREFNYSYAGEPYAELGCAHSTQPWTLGICNSLLSGRRDQARKLLQDLEMDGGIACEAFDSKTGRPYSGMAFATCAGYLAWAIWKAFGRQEGQAAQPQPQRQAAPAPRAGMGSVPAPPKPLAPAAALPKGAKLVAGKRSTKGVAAVVASEPLRPRKTAAKPAAKKKAGYAIKKKPRR